MNKIVKKLIIGGAIYGIAELSYVMGKGRMLSILRITDTSAPEAIKILSDDDCLKLRFIAWMGKQKL